MATSRDVNVGAVDMSSSLQAEIIERLTQAFSDLCNVAPDIESMAVAIGGTKYLIACALEKLGKSGPRRHLEAALKLWRESLSNSAARVGPSAAKESTPTVTPSSGGERGESLAPFCTGASASDLDSLLAAALVSRETH